MRKFIMLSELDNQIGGGPGMFKWFILMMILSSLILSSCNKNDVISGGGQIDCYDCTIYTEITSNPETDSYPISSTDTFPWCGSEEDLKLVEIETSGATEFIIDNILHTITTEQYTVCVKE